MQTNHQCYSHLLIQSVIPNKDRHLRSRFTFINHLNRNPSVCLLLFAHFTRQGDKAHDWVKILINFTWEAPFLPFEAGAHVTSCACPNPNSTFVRPVSLQGLTPRFTTKAHQAASAAAVQQCHRHQTNL